MKKIVFLLLFNGILLSTFSQITNGTINYELRADAFYQSCDNDAFSSDDNEVRIGLTSDANTGGTSTWTSGGSGASCSGNNYVRRWQSDAPSTTTTTNLLLYENVGRNNISNDFTINKESWEEDGSADCSSSGDACTSTASVAYTFKSGTKTPCRFWSYGGTADVASAWSSGNSNISLKSAWRYANGAACASPLTFGSLTNGVTYTHVNSNRSAPTGANANKGYTNVLGNAANDVFYSFTLSAPTVVTISTDNSETNYDTNLRLYNSNCGTEIASDDDSGITYASGLSSVLTRALCAGTYVVMVEGYSTNTGDFNLSIVGTALTSVTGGTIAGITDGGNICTGADPGAFTNSADGSGGFTVAAYSYGTTSYQWESSTTSSSSGFSNISGATSATYDPGTLSATTWFRRKTTDACSNTAYSNVIQVIVRPTPTATISGTASVCVGAASPNITFTNPQSLPVMVTYNINGGSNSTVNVAANSTSNVAQVTSSVNIYTYNLVSVAYQTAPTCTNTISGNAAITVVAQPTLSNPSLTNATICIGGSTAISTTVSGGTGTFNYQWQYSANGSTGWANVTTGTPTAFTYTSATSATLNIATTNLASAATSYYRCLLSTNTPAGAGCAATSANGVLTLVADPTSPSVSTKSPNVTSVCAGATLTTSIPTGGLAGVACSLEYRYTQNGGSTFSAASATLPTLTATATGYHAIEVRRNNCLLGCDQATAWQEIARWTVIADPAISGTTQPPSPICPGGSGTFTVTATGGTDGTGATIRTQQWQYSANGSTGWANVIDGTPTGVVYGGTGTSTSLSFSTTDGTTPAGTYYYRCIVGATGTDCGSVTSATLSMTVNAEAAPPTATMSPAVGCLGTSLTLINPTLGAGGAGTQTFQYSTTSGTGGFSGTVPSITAVLGSNSIWIRTTPGGSGCNNSTATQYTWTVLALPTATAPSAQTYCHNALTSAIPLTGTPSGVTFNISGGATIGLANQTGLTAIPAFTPITGSATVSIMPVSNGCTGTAVTYNITVNPRPTATTCKTDDPCQTIAGTIKVQITGGTSPYTITYSPSGTPASPIVTSSASTTISGLTGGQTYNFTVSDANGCIAP